LHGGVLVAHHYWGHGGETVFNLHLARALCRLGRRVAVAGVSRPPRPVEQELAAGCVEAGFYVIPLSVPLLAVYQRLLLSRALGKALARWRPSLVWVDAPTYKGALPRVREAGARLVEYIHFPLELADPGRLGVLPEPFRGEVEAYFARYRGSPFWRMYLSLYLRLQDRVSRGDPWEAADAVLANSRYVALIARHLWGRLPGVLHPPVDTEAFGRAARAGFEERENAVLVMGRVSPEKRVERVLEAAAMAEARPRVIVAGAVAASHRGYLQRVRGLAGRLGVELEVLANPSREEMVAAAGRARLYVHAAVGEHFGITVVEAMAAGLPVVVHRSGGPYYDIVEEGRWGLHYGSLEELAEAMDRVLGDPGEWRRLHEQSLARSREYSIPAFTRRLGEVLAGLDLHGVTGQDK